MYAVRIFFAFLQAKSAVHFTDQNLCDGRDNSTDLSRFGTKFSVGLIKTSVHHLSQLLTVNREKHKVFN